MNGRKQETIVTGSNKKAVLEFLNNLWGLGTEQEQGYRTGPTGTQAGGIDSLESIPGLHKSLKIRALIRALFAGTEKRIKFNG